MLVQQPDLPFFTITGEYYPLSSTPSTLTQPQLPGAIFGVSLPTAVIQSHQLALRRLINSEPLCQANPFKQSSQTGQHSSSPYFNPPTPSTNTMPRPSQPKANPDPGNSAFPGPPAPIIAGGKRGASAVSATAVLPSAPATGAPADSGEQPPLRLPPKLSEAERMMHVQRWVNHLPWPGSDTNSSMLQTHWGYSNLPGYRHIDEDREPTPPPSRTYLSRLPFTPEEEQIMIRYFTTNSDYRHQHPSVALNPYHSNQHLPYHNQRTAALHQAAANQHLTISAQQANHGLLSGGELEPGRCGPDRKPGTNRNVDGDTTGGNRFFAEWEIRLISHLFHEYFPGRPEPMGSCGVLPSVGEVRSRIATSRLKETRTATAVRSKIKRMQSSGTWFEYQ
ncbi:hypothetical protein T265_00337 [Opisthorchis viverrini]|uniref:Uncharacterized protein n=1 Tax=Opisthorchis viverrini TaxID=6198 RepID=A0A075ACX5_OPIVI|nr:hypothetical protein T265_00337 [Opisthorchis viverrini]KER33895.1 hypothetical protein T265_00337 [Opisthorchis viverrini]